MIKKVETYLKQFNMINPGDEIIAGVSGGADSVCMFLMLVKLREKFPFVLKVVHINHLIREDAASDAEFVENLCSKYGVPFYLFEEDVEKMARDKGISTEEAGRLVRYERFRQVMERADGKIAVAHNRNDVAETVLFNIFRGTGIEGLSSLNPVNGNIIRPIIGLTRAEIEGYLRENNQSFRTDSTNATNDYSRNKIRNVILPFAEQDIVTGATEHIAALSEKMLLVRDYIRKEAEINCKNVADCDGREAVIDVSKFRYIDKLMQNEVILILLERLTSGRKDIGQAHVEAIRGLIDKSGEKRVDLPYGLEAIKQYDRLIIRLRVESKAIENEYTIEEEDILLDDGKTLRVRRFENGKELCIPQNAYTKWFDYDKISECLKVRNKRQGDYLTINSELKKKSLKDYMIDMKIPRENRASLQVIADGSHILWVIGYRISEYYKVSDETKNIIEISVE